MEYVESKAKKEKWFVSPYNFSAEYLKNAKFPEKVELFDCTLREGEQHLGVMFTKEQKLAIARADAAIGIPFVEISLVAASEEDREVIRTLCAEDHPGTTFTALCRCLKQDIDMAEECGLKFIGIITLLCDTALEANNWTEEHVYDMIRDVMGYARGKGCFDHIAMMIVDGTKLSRDRLIKMIRTATPYIDSACVNDTFSSLSPAGAAAFIDDIQAQVEVPLHLHCHNDFGFGAANACAAASRGVKYVHGSWLGIGEKAGNAPLEQLIVALEMLYGANTGVDMTKIAEIVNMVSEITGLKRQSNMPVVGEGMHTLVGATGVNLQRKLVAGHEGGWEKWGTLLNPFWPSAIGFSDEPNVTLGKTSGSPNLQWYFDKWGLSLDRAQVKEVLMKLKQYSIEKNAALVSEEELKKIVADMGLM